MNRYNLLLCIKFVLILSLIILICIYMYRKRQNKPNWYIVVKVVMIYIIVFLFGGMLIDFDNNDNVFFYSIINNKLYEIKGFSQFIETEREIWEYNIYTTENGNQFIVEQEHESCFLVDRDNMNNKFMENQCYIAKDGILQIDLNNSYIKLDDNIYLDNQKNRVYRLNFCSYNIFGKLVINDNDGFYLNDKYIQPKIIEDNLENETTLSRYIKLLIIITLFTPLVIYIFKLLSFKTQRSIKKFYKLESDFSTYLISLIQIMLISIVSSSFVISLEILIITIVLALIIIAFLQGSFQIELDMGEEKIEKEYPFGFTLQFYFQNRNVKEVCKMQKKYLFYVILYYILWLGYCTL